MNKRKVDACVDALALLGCRKVTEIIGRLETGDVVTEADGLTAEETKAVLDELKMIMAVYDRGKS